MKIGVLALQGGFDLHAKRLKEIGVEAILVKKEEELDLIEGLIIPGGESTTLLKLCEPEFRKKIASKVRDGLPLLTTCAGTIFTAKKVSNPPQESLNLIDIDVERNSYGRQTESFITKEITADENLGNSEFEVVFIRAPRITRTGKNVRTLISLKSEPVLVQEKNVMAATFHPELSENKIHDYFLQYVRAN